MPDLGDPVLGLLQVATESEENVMGETVEQLGKLSIICLFHKLYKYATSRLHNIMACKGYIFDDIVTDMRFLCIRSQVESGVDITTTFLIAVVIHAWLHLPHRGNASHKTSLYPVLRSAVGKTHDLRSDL